MYRIVTVVRYLREHVVSILNFQIREGYLEIYDNCHHNISTTLKAQGTEQKLTKHTHTSQNPENYVVIALFHYLLKK